MGFKFSTQRVNSASPKQLKLVADLCKRYGFTPPSGDTRPEVGSWLSRALADVTSASTSILGGEADTYNAVLGDLDADIYAGIL